MIEIFDPPEEIDPDLLKEILKRVIRKEGVDKDLNVIFADNRYIQNLNKRFLKRNYPTDVLAFKGEYNLLGEIYISKDQALINSRDYGVSLKKELYKLALHGLLHLLGYSHKEMEGKEECYLLNFAKLLS